MKRKNIIQGIKDQGPLNTKWGRRRFFKNFFITRNAWGMFHKNSHYRADTGEAKVMYNTRKSAVKSAKAMRKKHDKYFSVYKCIYCDGYHLGRNRDNK